jgi:hypothetical protein
MRAHGGTTADTGAPRLDLAQIIRSR